MHPDPKVVQLNEACFALGNVPWSTSAADCANSNVLPRAIKESSNKIVFGEFTESSLVSLET